MTMRWIPVLLLLAGCAQAGAAPVGTPRWGIVIHGGAGTIERGSMTPEMERQYREALEAALRAGHAVLERGGSSLDAVEAAINLLEDSPLFNAGRGAAFTAEGKNELDASIMEGRTRRAGAVAGVTHVRNPIDLARAVMESSPHVMMVGAGAEAFAKEQGIELVEQSYFFTEHRWRSLQAAQEAERRGWEEDLAEADAAVIGAGTYADNRCGGISATGHGEYFIRSVVAYDICAITLYSGIPLRDAADRVIMEKLVEFGGEGGVVALDPQGNVSMVFNSSGMYRGFMIQDGAPFVAIHRE